MYLDFTVCILCLLESLSTIFDFLFAFPIIYLVLLLILLNVFGLIRLLFSQDFVV